MSNYSTTVSVPACTSVRKLVCSAVCLALCLLLPFLTGQIPQIGSALSPMHIPVLLAGFLCGPWWAMAVGALAPLMRFALFQMPPIFPTGLAMCFELATYGAVSGLLYTKLPQKKLSIYGSLIAAMLAGRVVWGIVMALISGVSGSPFTWTAFLAGAFVNAVPGIVVHVAIIPILVLSVEKIGLMKHRA